jgi:hypothetical protein
MKFPNPEIKTNSPRLSYGLGKESNLDSVEVQWPSGLVEKLQNVAPDNIYTLVEGKGIRDTKPLPAP